MLPKFVVLAALVAVSSTGAFARTTPLQATLANPAQQHETIASSIIWRCDGTTCASISDASSSSDVNACRSLAKTVGPITAFSSARGAFDDAHLQKCNGTSAAK